MDRIKAAQLIDQLDLLMVSQADENTKKEYREGLRERLGTPVHHRKEKKTDKNDILALMQEID